MKKTIMYLALFLMLISFVFGTVNVDSKTVEDISSFRVWITINLNESSNVTEFVLSYNADLSNPVYTTTDYNTFATTHVFDLNNLLSNQLYYYNITGLGHDSNTSYNTGLSNFTTLQIMRGTSGNGGRVLLLIAVLVTAFILLGYIKAKYGTLRLYDYIIVTFSALLTLIIGNIILSL